MIDVQSRCKPDSRVKGAKYLFIIFVNCYLWLRCKPDSKSRVQDIFGYCFVYIIVVWIFFVQGLVLVGHSAISYNINYYLVS
jgi:hypothetical protein